MNTKKIKFSFELIIKSETQLNLIQISLFAILTAFPMDEKLKLQFSPFVFTLN